MQIFHTRGNPKWLQKKNLEERTCLKYSLLYLISSQKLQKIRKKAIMPCKYRNQRMYKNEN